MGKIMYDPSKDKFITHWDMMEIRKNSATVWIDGKSYELDEEESANLLFQNSTPESEEKFMRKFTDFIGISSDKLSDNDIIELLKDIIGNNLDIEI